MLRSILSSVISMALVATAAAAAPRPNIIFVLTDDLGWGDLGVLYQNSRNFAVNRNLPAFATPKLDTMAAQGARMNRHYCPAPVCAPSRASLLLGVHQGHSNVRDNQFDKELANNHTLGTVLKQAGYATAAIGKWGVGGGSGFPGHPQNRGFDYFFGYMPHGDAHYHYPKEQGRRFYENFTDIAADLDKCYSTDLTTGRSKQWIVDHRTANPSQPFFLYLCFAAPHAQLNVPTGPYPAGGGLNGGIQWNGTPGTMINTATGDIDTWIHPDYQNATWDHDNNPGTAEQGWTAYAKRHATMIRRIDDAMGDLFHLLVDLEIDDNTLVVFTSDNGPHNEAGANGSYTQDPRFFRSYGPLDGIKRDVWEGGIRMPTLVRWPGGIPAARVSTHPSQFHDWMNTFAELAGISSPFRSDGVSLVPDLTGVGSQKEGVVYVEYYASGTTPTYSDFTSTHRGATRNQMQAIFHAGYKGVRYNIGSADTLFRIHDVANDPQETTNLAGQAGVPSQADLKARVAQVRRAGGGVSRVYDSVPVPAVVPSLQENVTLLRSDFNGRALSGTTASGISWTSDRGEESNATTSLTFTGSASGFISGYGLTSGALNPPGEPIPVAGNIETVGSWSTSFQFTPSASHALSAVEVASYSISATGVHQGNAKSIRWDVAIQGGSLHETAFAEGSEPGGNGALTLAVDFSGVTLVAGTTYTITLTASSPAPSGGNNIALNSITLTEAGSASGLPAGMKSGLKYAAHEASFPWVPDFVGMTPAATGESTGIDLSVRSRDDDIGIAFSGYLKVPTEGSYTFFLTTDTGAFIRLHDLQLVDADFGYTGGTERSSGSIPLAAGLHPIRIHYRHSTAASHTLTLEWQGPGLAKQPIPNTSFLVEEGADSVSSTIWLPFDETSGTIAHDALGQPLGTLTGFATPDWVAGKWGGALRFFGDGDVDSVAIAGNKGVIGSAARTVTFWIHADAYQAGARPTIISWGDDNSPTPGSRFDINLNPSSDYRLRGEFNASGINFETPSRSDLRGAGWVHCAVVVPENATVAQVLAYLDGEPATATLEPTDSGGTAINTAANNDLTIGNWATDAGRPLRGILDDVRIHPRALSAHEIAALAAQTPDQTSAAAWFFRHTGNDLPDATDWHADTDADGLPAILEYALGGNPTEASLAVAPILTADFDFLFNRRVAGLSSASYISEYSTTLEADSWIPLSPSAAVPHPELAGFEQVTVPLPETVDGKGFMRLRVTGP
jgi:arylsulfatase A-like enzyme